MPDVFDEIEVQSPSGDIFDDVAYEAPDEFGIGQEVRGFGRALKRGTLAAGRNLLTAVADINQRFDGTEKARKDAEDALQRSAEIEANFPEKPTLTERLTRWKAQSEAQTRRRELDGVLAMPGRIAGLQKRIEDIPPSPDLANLQTDFWRTLATNPIETIATVAAESIPQSIAGTLGGAAVAGPVGAIAGTAGSSLGTEYAATLLETAKANGYDITTEAGVRRFFEDKVALSEARSKGLKRGLSVAAFDAASAGIAGRFINPVLRGTTGPTVRGVIKASGKELGAQMFAGAAGETAGQLASEGRITSPEDIALEAIAEIGSAPAEVASNLRAKSAARLRATGSPITAAAVSIPSPDELSAEQAQLSDLIERVGKSLETEEQEATLQTSPSDVVAPMPETDATLAKQIEVTASPDSTKAVTLVTPGENTPNIPEGLLAVETPHGVAIYNPAKVTEAQVIAAGKGSQFDGRLLGMSQGTKPVESNIAVTTTTPDGVEVISEVVEDDPDAIAKATEAQAAAVPSGTTTVEDASTIIQRRIDGKEETALPPAAEPAVEAGASVGDARRGPAIAEAVEPTPDPAAGDVGTVAATRKSLRREFQAVPGGSKLLVVRSGKPGHEGLVKVVEIKPDGTPGQDRLFKSEQDAVRSIQGERIEDGHKYPESWAMGSKAWREVVGGETITGSNVRKGTEMPAEPGATPGPRRYRVGSNPQPLTIIEELEPLPGDLEGEKYVVLRNEKTGETGTFELSTLTPLSNTVEALPASTGARKATAEGMARVEAAKKKLRAIINNPDLIGRERADSIENGKNLIAFLQVKADTRRPMETDYVNGDQVAFTGEDAPEGFRHFIYLEGHKAGDYGVTLNREEKAKNVARAREELKPKAQDAPAKQTSPARDLDAELRAAGMDPSGFTTKAQKVEALKRAKAKATKQSLTSTKAAGIPVAEAQQAVAAIAPKAKVTVSDAEPPRRTVNGREFTAKGAVDTEGNVTLYAKALDSPQDAKDVIVEELGHLAARNPDYIKLTDRLFNALDPAELAAMRKAGYKAGEAPEEAIMRRVVSMAQKRDAESPLRKAWNDLVEWLTRQLREWGWTKSTEQDARQLLRAALKAQKMPGRTSLSQTFADPARDPVRDGSKRRPSQSAIDSTRMIPVDTEPERDAEAEAFVEKYLAEYNGDYNKVFAEAEQIKSADSRTVTKAKVLRQATDKFIAGGMHDPIQAADLRRMADSYQGQKTEDAKALQSSKQGNKELDPFRAFYSWMDILRTNREAYLDARFKPETIKAVVDAIVNAGKRRLMELSDALGNKPEAMAIFDIASRIYRTGKGGFTFKASDATPAEAKLAERIMGQFPLADIRKFYSEDGGKRLASDWWKILAGPRDPEGHLWTADKALQGELGGILREALAKVGVLPNKTTPMPTAEKLALALGKGELRQGKVEAADKLVREELDRRMQEELEKAGEDEAAVNAVEVKYSQLRSAWDEAVGAMFTQPASGSLLRRMLNDGAKELKVDWNSLFSKDSPLDATKKSVVDSVVAEVKAVSNQPAPSWNEAELRRALESEFDRIASTQRNRWEVNEVGRRARAALRETAKPEQTAQSIIAKLAERQSDTPTWTKPQINSIRKSLASYLDGDMTTEEFRASLEQTVSGSTADTLVRIAARERAVIEATEYARERERVAAWLASNPRIDALLSKAGREEGMDWEELFRSDIGVLEERLKDFGRKILNRPEFKKLTPPERLELFKALANAAERRKAAVVRKAFDKLVPLPNVGKKDRAAARDAVEELIGLNNLGLLNNEAFRNALAKKMGLESLDGPTGRKLAALGKRAQKAPAGLPRHRLMQKMMNTLMDAQPTDWRLLLNSIWFGDVLLKLATDLNAAVGSAGSSAMFHVAQSLDRAARGDLKGAARLQQQYISGLLEGAQVAGHVLRTGDYSVLSDFEERVVEFLEGKATPDQLEKFLKGKNIVTKIFPGSLAVARRSLTAIDCMFGTGTRDASILYAALTRKDKDSIDAIARKWDKAATANADAQARRELGRLSDKAQITVRRRQILEEGVSQEVKDSALNLGKRVAANAEPQGLPGVGYKIVSLLPFWAKAPLGLAFIRSAMNNAQNAMDVFPGVGLAKAAWGYAGERQAAGDTGLFRFAKPIKLGKSGISVPVANTQEERRIQVALQMAGSAFTVALGYSMIGHDDEEDGPRRIDITGPWSNVSPKERSVLLSRGEKPNALIYRNEKGEVTGSTSYRNTPVMANLAMIGALRDKQRFAPDEFTAENFPQQVFLAGWQGLYAIKDMSAISAMSDVFNISAGGTDDPDKGMERISRGLSSSVGRFATGFIPFSSLLKEIDEIQDPQLYRPENRHKLAGYWMRHIPFARRIGGGPELDIFGEPIKQTRPPFKQYIGTSPSNDPAWRALGYALDKGVFPTYVTDTTKVTENGEQRRMTPEEFGRYRVAFGKAMKEKITENSADILKMDREQLAEWFHDDKRWTKVKEEAKREAVP